MLLDDGTTAPARVRRLTPDRLEIILHEGRKRQVRRMCEAVGHRVVRLERVAFGPLRLGDLPLGGHRRLNGAEVEQLKRAPPERGAELAPAGAGDGLRPYAPHRCGSSPFAAPTRSPPTSPRDPRRHRVADARADRRNGLDTGDLVSCLFTLTPDLDAEFPAVAARRMGFSASR